MPVTNPHIYVWVAHCFFDNINLCSSDYLLDEDSFFHDVLQDLDRKNEEYLCLKAAKWCHPNFEKASWRLNRILDIICSEIETRRI